LNHDPPDRCLLSRWDYRHETPAPTLLTIFIAVKKSLKQQIIRLARAIGMEKKKPLLLSVNWMEKQM
jgi:predicted component of type VI protein secretion system